MTADIWVPAVLFLFMALLHVLRQKETRSQSDLVSSEYEVGAASTLGSREIQQDYFGVRRNQGAVMMVLADGIGMDGGIAAKVSVDTFIELFETTTAMQKPKYFFRRAANLANRSITNTLEERQGESSLAAVLVDGEEFFYTVVGNCRITVFRNGDLVPVSEGHTIDVLARHSYSEGRISRQETLALLNEHRRYNVLGQDSFDEIEFLSKPLEMRKNDLIVMMSEGIFNTLRWADIENVLEKGGSVQKLADEIVGLVNSSPMADKDNGTILIFRRK